MQMLPEEGTSLDFIAETWDDGDAKQPQGYRGPFPRCPGVPSLTGKPWIPVLRVGLWSGPAGS